MAKAIKLKNLLDIEPLSLSQITTILDDAQNIIDRNYHLTAQRTELREFTVANLFFEPSTRTRVSFELAARRLGATVVNLDLKHSSLEKGEALMDTIYSLQAMNCQLFIVRHKQRGTTEFISQHLDTNTALINAGEGSLSHPTQALLDALTIRQHKPDFSKLKIAIVGDVLHSRVARSDIEAFKLLSVPEICVVGPKDFIPHDAEKLGVHVYHDLASGIANADVVITLRIQKERMLQSDLPDSAKYHEKFGLTTEMLKLAKSDAIVMHPGPINRGIEIDSKVADGSQSLIQQQVTNGVAIRMAVLLQLANTIKS